MCIIAIKNAKQKPFTEEMVRTMFTNNPDGAGYMTTENGKVNIRKGFMKVEHLLSSLASLSPDVPVVLHCRIATHGNVVQGLCHPFPVVSDFSKMRAKKTKCDVGMVHNGIISCADSSHDVSDTMSYIQSVVSPLLSLNEHALQSPAGKSILATSCGSKLAFLDGRGRITTIGDFQVHDGFLFSNGSYQEKVWLPPTKTHFFTHQTGYTSALYDTYDDGTCMIPLMVLTDDYKLKSSDGTVITGELWGHAISGTGGVYRIQADGYTAVHLPNTTACDTFTGETIAFDSEEAELYEIW
jgi:hypothetical protein